MPKPVAADLNTTGLPASLNPVSTNLLLTELQQRIDAKDGRGAVGVLDHLHADAVRDHLIIEDELRHLTEVGDGLPQPDNAEVVRRVVAKYLLVHSLGDTATARAYEAWIRDLAGAAYTTALIERVYAGAGPIHPTHR